MLIYIYMYTCTTKHVNMYTYSYYQDSYVDPIVYVFKYIYITTIIITYNRHIN